MGKVESVFGTPTGPGATNAGQMLGAVGAGVQRARMGAAQDQAWLVTAQQFATLGPEGQKIAALIQQSPQVADAYAKRMGGWADLYSVTKGGFQRNQLAKAIAQAGADQRYTGAEKADINLLALSQGINPAAAMSVVNSAQGNFEATMNQMDPHNWDPESLFRMRQTWEQTGDPMMALAEAQPRTEEGLQFPKSSPELLKLQMMRARLKEEGKEGSQEAKEVNQRIAKLLKSTAGGKLTESSRRLSEKVREARKYITGVITQGKPGGGKYTRAELFGQDPNNPLSVLGGAKDPLMAQQMRLAMDHDPLESQAQYADWIDWITQNAPVEAGWGNFSPAPASVVNPTAARKDTDDAIEKELDAMLSATGLSP